VNAADEYAIYALLTNLGALPWGAEASWLGQWIWAPGLGLILVFLPLLFPDGHPPSHRWRPVAWLGGLSIGLGVVSSTRSSSGRSPIGRAPVLSRCGVGVGRRNWRLHCWVRTPPRKIRHQFR